MISWPTLRISDRPRWEARVRDELAVRSYGEVALRLRVAHRTIVRWARELGCQRPEGWPRGKPRKGPAEALRDA